MTFKITELDLFTEFDFYIIRHIAITNFRWGLHLVTYLNLDNFFDLKLDLCDKNNLQIN